MPDEVEVVEVPGGGLRAKIISESKQLVGEFENIPKSKHVRPPVIDDAPTPPSLLDESVEPRKPIPD